MELTIRDAAPEDASMVADIYMRSKAASLPNLLTDRDRDLEFQISRWTRYIVEGSTAQFAKGDSHVFLAEADGQTVGYIAWHSSTRHGTQTELQSLYVLKEFQSQGIGAALFAHVAGEILSRGLRSMCVGFDPANPYRRFYLKLGAKVLNGHWAVWDDVASALA